MWVKVLSVSVLYQQQSYIFYFWKSFHHPAEKRPKCYQAQTSFASYPFSPTPALGFAVLIGEKAVTMCSQFLIHKVKLMPNCSACVMSHQFMLRKLDRDSGIWTVLFGFMSDFLCFLSKSFSLWLHQFSSVFPCSICTLWRWTAFVTYLSEGQWFAITLNFV